MVDCPGYEWNQSWNPATSAWQTDSKLEYTYSGRHAPDQVVQYFSNNGRLDQQYRKTRTFDDAGRMLTQVIEDNEEGKWQFSEQNKTAFDQTSGNYEYEQTFWSYGKWNSITRTRVLVDYDANGLATTELFQRWNKEQNRYASVIKTTNHYNSKDQIDAIRVSYIGPDGAERPFSIETIDGWYNYEKGQKSNSQTRIWNKELHAYQLVKRQDFSYLNDVLVKYNAEEYANGVAVSKKTTIYDGNGLMIADTDYYWKEDWKIWNSKRWSYTFDEKGRLVESVMSALRDGDYRFMNRQMFGDFCDV